MSHRRAFWRTRAWETLLPSATAGLVVVGLQAVAEAKVEHGLMGILSAMFSPVVVVAIIAGAAAVGLTRGLTYLCRQIYRRLPNQRFRALLLEIEEEVYRLESIEEQLRQVRLHDVQYKQSANELRHERKTEKLRAKITKLSIGVPLQGDDHAWQEFLTELCVDGKDLGIKGARLRYR